MALVITKMMHVTPALSSASLFVAIDSGEGSIHQSKRLLLKLKIFAFPSTVMVNC